MKSIFFMIAIFLYTGQAFANNQACPMIEQTQLNISFNSQEIDPKEIKSKVDDKLKFVEQQAKKIGITKIDMKSMNYNLHANNAGNYQCQPKEKTYRLNGNMNFDIYPSQKALDLLVHLDEKGYTSRLNVNKYPRCR